MSDVQSSDHSGCALLRISFLLATLNVASGVVVSDDELIEEAVSDKDGICTKKDIASWRIELPFRTLELGQEGSSTVCSVDVGIRVGLDAGNAGEGSK